MRSVFILFSLLSFASMAIPKDSIRTEKRVEGIFVIHEVEEEETLYSLARRYGSTLDALSEHNELENNRIEIGQVLNILLVTTKEEVQIVEIPEGYHKVKQGETLYTVSRIYDMRVRELRKLNNLSGNSISVGQLLKISKSAEEIQAKGTTETEPPKIRREIDESKEEFTELLVQTGETLRSIALKNGVTVQAIKEWNNLNSDFIRIGQRLKLILPSDSVTVVADSTQTNVALNEDGFERVYEEGIAATIERTTTTKYLALHRSLPMGTELQVRNLMNNYVVHVKVVGKLPDTGLNKNILLRLSKSAYDQLGILDPKARVEVSYYRE